MSLPSPRPSHRHPACWLWVLLVNWFMGGMLPTASGSPQPDEGQFDSRRGTTLKYNLSNGRGDIVAQSNAVGELTWTASYEAYGKRTKETGANADKQRANSKDEDPTGLLNEGFRYRDLETGVWLSRDPAGFVDGPNLYAYVMQNPWSKWDPRGLSPEEMLVGNQAVQMQKTSDRDGSGVYIIPILFAPAAIALLPEAGAAAVLKEVGDEAFDQGFEAVTGVSAPPTSITDLGQKLFKKGGEKIAKEGMEKTAQNIAKQSEEIIEKVDPRKLVSRQGPSEMTGSKVKRLAKDMKANGFNPNHPIEAADVDGRRIIIDGHHRAEAAKKAGIPEVPVKKVEVTAEKAAKLSQQASDASAEKASRSR
jgi:RHS repeat-associated protein